MQRLYGVAMNVEATEKELAVRIAELPPATRRCVGWLAERIAAAEDPHPSRDPSRSPSRDPSREPSRHPRDAPRGDAPVPSDGDTRASLEAAAAALLAAPAAEDLAARQYFVRHQSHQYLPTYSSESIRSFAVTNFCTRRARCV